MYSIEQISKQNWRHLKYLEIKELTKKVSFEFRFERQEETDPCYKSLKSKQKCYVSQVSGLYVKNPSRHEEMNTNMKKYIENTARLEDSPDDSQIKKSEELLERGLVHAVDEAHLGDEEVKDAPPGGNRSILFSRGRYLLLRFCRCF